LVFVIFAVVSFEYANRYDIKRQRKASDKVESVMEGLTSVLESDVKRETKFKKEFSGKIDSVASEMKKQDKALASELQKQKETLRTGIRKQKEVNVEVKKKISRLSDMKKRQPAEKSK
jgi:DUF4097 and DUF4098 domain-containing protein YvlB